MYVTETGYSLGIKCIYGSILQMQIEDLEKPSNLPKITRQVMKLELNLVS